jgi:hypothetical protein
MPKKTYTQINRVTLAAASASVIFSSIPQNFRDLILVSNQEVSGSFGLGIRFNGDSGSSYPQVMIRNSANSVSSGSETGVQFYGSWGSQTANTRYLSIFQIMDYSATDKHKSTLLRNGYTDANNGAQCVEAFAGRWANTSAVSSINVFATSSSGFSTGSTFTLYGIEA